MLWAYTMKVDIKIVIWRKEASKIKSSAGKMVEKYKTQEKEHSWE